VVANYDIKVRVDPGDAQQGGAQVRATLQDIQTAAATTKTSVDRALQFNSGPAVAATGAVNAALGETQRQAAATATAVSRAGQSFGIMAAGSMQAAAQMRTTNQWLAQTYNLSTQVARGNQMVTTSLAQQRMGLVQGGQQFNDFATQVISGTSVVQAFAQQAGQAAFAMSLMGGATGRVGQFLAGPWGTLIIVGTTILAGFVTQLLNTEKQADATKDAIADFAAAQRDLANFIDFTTGKLIQQAGALAVVARNAKLAQIAQEQQQSTASRTAAFTAARQAAGDGTPVYTAGGVTQPRTDRDIEGAIARAKGDVGALSTELLKLARTSRPDLLKLASEVTNLGGAAITSEGKVKTLTGEVQDLNTALRGGVVTTGAMVDRQVALATATNSLERAQARLAIVRARGAAVDQLAGKEREAAAAQYRRDLTNATQEVNREQAAIDAARKARSASNKEQREAEAAARKAAAQARQISDFIAQLEDQAAALEMRGVGAAVEQQIDAFTRRFDRAPSTGERQRITDAQERIQLLNDEKAILDQLLGPVEQYRRQIAALTDLLARGKITQDQYNQSLGQLPLAQAVAQVDKSLSGTLFEYNAQVQAIRDSIAAAVKVIDDAQQAGILSAADADARRLALRGTPGGADEVTVNGGLPNNLQDRQIRNLNRARRDQLGQLDSQLEGTGFQRNEEAERIRRQYEDRLQMLRDFRDAELLDEEEFSARKLAIVEDRERQIDELERARTEMRVAAAQEVSGALLQVAKDYAGEQSGIYKAIFAVDKAFAIAQAVLAIQQNIAQASKAGFPANIPFIAAAIAQGASILSNIRAVTAAFADGGYVDGPGGPRDDRILARLSAGEFVVNASATSRNRTALEAINAGRAVSAPQTTAPVVGPQGQRPVVQIHNYTGQPVRQEYDGDNRLRVMIGEEIDKKAPGAVARDMGNRNGVVQKAMRRTTTVKTETV
jgi:hypothetical protein